MCFDAIRSCFLGSTSRLRERRRILRFGELFDGIDLVMDDEIAGLVRNFEKVQGRAGEGYIEAGCGSGGRCGGAIEQRGVVRVRCR